MKQKKNRSSEKTPAVATLATSNNTAKAKLSTNSFQRRYLWRIWCNNRSAWLTYVWRSNTGKYRKSQLLMTALDSCFAQDIGI